MPSDPGHVAVDAELLADARRRYTGRGDLADQLWWLEHPGTRGPSGAEDPAPALEAARAALFRPDRPADADPDEIRRRLDLLDADRAAARSAIAAARADAPPQAATVPPPRRPRSAVPVAVGLAALIVGAVLGFAVARSAAAPTSSALAVFDSVQRAQDVPPATADLPPVAARSGYRLLGSSPTTGAYAYGVRRSDGDVCLVVVVLATSTYSTCTSAAAFALGGLTLGFQADVDPTDDSGVVQPVGIHPSWAPDGGFSF
ncbi:hypothetical protein [Amnibacterium kyonggiense]|uniref:Uncharacterized protein n=1 Tax=Amnibacterium kyonggiense TaxID=595671 RepID=A0A4V3EB47_9MICO|nr:hypothetical protein [Amnibacterium kyonggiense]TDS79544.1 hypothetical protein CLV52_0075 [Amnibacterium kyonggiense]